MKVLVLTREKHSNDDCKLHLESRGHKTRVLKDTRCRTALRELHNEYVLVPADKASNNKIIVCKNYYTEVIRNELAGKSGKASSVVTPGTRKCVILG